MPDATKVIKMLVSVFNTYIKSGLNYQVNGKSIEVSIFLDVTNEDSLSKLLSISGKVGIVCLLSYFTMLFLLLASFFHLSYTRG